MLRTSLCVLGLLTSLGSWSMLAAQQRVPAEQRLPKSVLAFASCPSLPEMQKKFQDTSYAGLVNDPAMADFRQEILSRLVKAGQRAERELGMPLSDLASLLSGELAMAVVRPVGQPVGLVVLMDCGDHDQIVEQLLAKADAALSRDSNVTKETEEIDGTKISIYNWPMQPEVSVRPTLAFFLKDHTLAIGSSLAVLETVLDRWDGSDPDCFAQHEQYVELRKQCLTADSQPVMTWMVTPIELIMAGLALSPQTQLYGGIASAYLPTLGLNKLKAYGGTLELATADYDYLSKTVVITNPPPTGLLKVFEFPATLTGPPDWVPADASQYLGVNWNISGAYQAIGAIYDTFQGRPGSFEQLVDGLARNPGAGGLHIKKDIVDVLSGEVQLYTGVPANLDLTSGDLPISGVAAIGVHDAAKAEALVTRLLNEGNVDSNSRTLNGVKVIEIPGDRTVVVAFTNSHILISDDAAKVELAANGGVAAPLSKGAVFAALQPHLPAQSSLISWSDPAGQWEPLYESVRSGAFDNSLDSEIDLGKLPKFEAIRKYMQPAISYMVPTERGSMTVGLVLKKKD